MKRLVKWWRTWRKRHCPECQRFQKLGMAQCEAKIGTRLVLLQKRDDGDVVVASLILTNITWSDLDGTSVQFRDYFHWLNQRRL